MVRQMNNQNDPVQRRTFCWLAWLVLVILPISANADVQLELDRLRMVEGETVTLTFVTDDPGQSLDADLSPGGPAKSRSPLSISVAAARSR